MTGSPSSSWTVPPGDSCDRLTSDTTLTSPNRDVVSLLKPGTELNIEVDESGDTPLVRAVYNGQIAGSITSSIIQKLVQCVENGYSYVAEVKSVEGGTCKVRVRVK